MNFFPKTYIVPLQRTTQFHKVSFCLYVADPATFLAWDSVLGILFYSENTLFIFSYGKD